MPPCRLLYIYAATAGQFCTLPTYCRRKTTCLGACLSPAHTFLPHCYSPAHTPACLPPLLFIYYLPACTATCIHFYVLHTHTCLPTPAAYHHHHHATYCIPTYYMLSSFLPTFFYSYLPTHLYYQCLLPPTYHLPTLLPTHHHHHYTSSFTYYHFTCHHLPCHHSATHYLPFLLPTCILFLLATPANSYHRVTYPQDSHTVFMLLFCVLFAWSHTFPVLPACLPYHCTHHCSLLPSTRTHDTTPHLPATFSTHYTFTHTGLYYMGFYHFLFVYTLYTASPMPSLLPGTSCLHCPLHACSTMPGFHTALCNLHTTPPCHRHHGLHIPTLCLHLQLQFCHTLLPVFLASATLLCVPLHTFYLILLSVLHLHTPVPLPPFFYSAGTFLIPTFFFVYLVPFFSHLGFLLSSHLQFLLPTCHTHSFTTTAVHTAWLVYLNTAVFAPLRFFLPHLPARLLPLPPVPARLFVSPALHCHLAFYDSFFLYTFSFWVLPCLPFEHSKTVCAAFSSTTFACTFCFCLPHTWVSSLHITPLQNFHTLFRSALLLHTTHYTFLFTHTTISALPCTYIYAHTHHFPHTARCCTPHT